MAFPKFFLSLFLLAVPQINGDKQPYFMPGSGDMSGLKISEDTPLGTPVYQLRAVDPEGGSIHYSISGTRLSVDSQTGVVTLRESLDREKQPVIEVIISATDGADNTVSLRRFIHLGDVNDNVPQFKGRPYSVGVKENAPIGFRLPIDIRVTDDDLGKNAEISVTCAQEGDLPCENFQTLTERLTEGSYRVYIEVKRPLDHEVRSAHVLTLKARDNGDQRLHSTANVAISVLDVADTPPEFLEAPYSAAVLENSPPGTKVLDIAARDGDTGQSRREVVLHLGGDKLGFFKLVPKKTIGGITKATLVTSDTPLDREHPVVQQGGGVYTFDVIAAEIDPNSGEESGDFSISQVTVIITDADDQLPEFDSEVYQAAVRENLQVDDQIPGLSITITDNDLGANARYYLRLEYQDVMSADALKISPEKGEGRTPLLFRVADPSLLDYESGVRDIAVDVIASKIPNGEPLASARVNLKILDANDHAPRFARASYRFRIPENASIGTRIDNLENPLVAQDSDDGEFGHITYSIRGFGAGVFTTDPENGGLRVAAPLDREKQAAFTLAVEAKDGGGRLTQVNVHVDILDTNDNSPQFEQREYSRVVREGAQSFDPQLFVRATDIDGETQGGGKISYSIDENSEWSEVFTVDESTGEIRMLRAVSGNEPPRGQYEFLVRATDFGDPPLYNTTRIVIRVGLVGNQRPIWRGAENDRLYSAQVPETAPAGHLVTTIKAHDPDGADSLLRYRLANSGEDNFVLNEITGELRISTDSRLDRDLDGAPSKYNILVAAIDGGPGPVKETSTATVQVEIKDVNDELPKFPVQNLTGYISERAEIGSVILKIMAQDPDEGSKVQYSLGKIKALDGAGLPVRSGANYDPMKAFAINETTGELLVNGPLDHRSTAVVLVQVLAEDTAAVGEKQVASTDVTIYIQAFEDNSPYFLNEGWTHGKPEIHVNLEEEKPIGTKVLELKAYDPRLKTEIRRYEMIESSTDALTVLPDGDVLLTRRVDYERPGDKLLELKVKTATGSLQEAQADIYVHVIDLNDNPPKFEKDEYSATILESAKHPKTILQITATDLDLTSTPEEISRGFGFITYSLGSSNNFFEINSTSGEIKIAEGAVLDRERQAFHNLEVTARDGGGRKSTTTVKVTVEDVNDNRPKWNTLAGGELTAVIPENSAPGEKAADLQAFDPDLNEGGELTYELIDQGEAIGLFSLDEKTGKLTVARALTGKGRTEPYVMTIRATDGGGLHSDAPLHLFIGDVSANDGVPEWIKPKIDEMAKISENASVGSMVYKALAEDPDDQRTSSGQISYSILDGDSTFVIDSNNGMVTLKKPLDREKKDRYTLVLVAADNGTPPQQASRVLQVIILDVDDNQPRFNRLTDDPPQLLEIDEEVSIGTKIGQVQAFDPDLGENAEIAYYIIGGNDQGLFSIDTNGTLTSSGRLDREEISQHLLTVRCTKRSATAPTTQAYNRLDPSEIQVLVHLRDVDDNSPIFVDGDNITVGVRAWTPTDTLVTRLEAHDKDSASRPIEYRLIGGNFTPGVMNEEFSYQEGNVSEVFRLDTTTGELRTTRPLINFADGAFNLYAQAISGNRSITAQVKIHVARDRDLLRWVFARPPADVRRDLPDFEKSFTEILGGETIPLIYDARFLARRDGSLDFGSTGACFGLISNDGTNMTLSREEALQVLNANEENLRKLYATSRVVSVERCDGASKTEGSNGVLQARATYTQTWLLLIASLVGIGGLISCCVLCCMHCSYKKKTARKMRLLNEGPQIIHAPIYPEPLYST